MSLKYYDRDGKPLTQEQFIDFFESLCDVMSYKRVAETTLSDGKWVSTVWLGLDHRFLEEGPPLIFETMVFPSHENLLDLACSRWSTLEEATVGHEEVVKKWTKKIEDERQQKS